MLPNPPASARPVIAFSAVPLVLCLALAAAACRPPDPAAVAPRVDGARGNAVLLNGHFTDWQVAGAPLRTRFVTVDGSAVRLDTLWAADDAAWMYLSFAVRDTITAQGLPGTLHVLLDTDDAPTTGETVFGAAGIDAVVDLSPTNPGPTGTRGAGLALRTPDGNAVSRGLGARRNAHDLGLVVMPTWSATRFELRLARSGAPDGFARLGQTVRIQLVFEDQGTILSRSDIVRHTLRSRPGPDPFRRASPGIPSRAAGSVRVAQWNVAGERFRTPGRHARLLATDIHESRAGDGRAYARRAHRHLRARLRPVRDAHRRCAIHRLNGTGDCGEGAHRKARVNRYAARSCA